MYIWICLMLSLTGVETDGFVLFEKQAQVDLNI